MKTILFLLALLSPVPAWALDCYSPGEVVAYSAGYNDDTGSAVDPASPTATVRITPLTGTATYAALTAPAKLNATTGWFGGEYTVPAGVDGLREIVMGGTVATAKTPISVVARFNVLAVCPDNGLTAAAIAAIWNESQSGHTTAGTFGLYLDSAVTSRSTFDPVADTVANVTIVATTNTNADMRGTNNAATASNQVVMQTDVTNVLTDTGTTIPAQITGLNNVAATDIVSAGAITTLAGAVVNVDLVDVTTTNTDQRGTDGANTATPLSAAQINAEVDTAFTTINPSDLSGRTRDESLGDVR